MATIWSYFIFVFATTASCVFDVPHKPSRSDTTQIEWKNITFGYETLLWQPELVGYEPSYGGSYLCRAYEQGTWTPGKLWPMEWTLTCIVSKNGKEYPHTSFQMLQAPKGATSWQPSYGKVPNNAVPSSVGADGFPRYICRTIISGCLIPGTYLAPNCWVAAFGKERRSSENVEVLILNQYGTLILGHTEMDDVAFGRTKKLLQSRLSVQTNTYELLNLNIRLMAPKNNARKLHNYAEARVSRSC